MDGLASAIDLVRRDLAADTNQADHMAAGIAQR
jgi:hypothetical protein